MWGRGGLTFEKECLQFYVSSEHDPTMRAVHVLKFEERCGGKKILCEIER